MRKNDPITRCRGRTAGGAQGLAVFLAVFLAVLTGLLPPGAPSALGGGDPPHVPIPGGLRGKTCYECHIGGAGIILPSQEKPRVYSKSEAFRSYLESPHGRLRRLGDRRAPMCEDCHLTREWRDIMPQEHPDSPIHPSNLPAICAKCHGEAMRRANVARGSMHMELAHRSLLPGRPMTVRYGFLPGITKQEAAYFIGPFDVTAYINWFFILLTVGTLVAFSLYMVSDLYRKLMERRDREPGEKDHE